MEEPPAKRPRRLDPSANDRSSPFDSQSGKDTRYRSHNDGTRENSHGARREDDRRKRSRSRDHDARERRRERSRSRDRDRSYRDRDRDRDKDRYRTRDRDRDGRDREPNGVSRRERSKSRDRHRANKEYFTEERSSRPSRSRSPAKNGEGTPVRTRSPPRRSDHDRSQLRTKPKIEEDDSKEKWKAATQKATANGNSMQLDEDDEDAYLRKMMGFTAFKTTHNTKVPGNQIYGVRKEKKTEYRQYMNRIGGFNRPLSPSR